MGKVKNINDFLSTSLIFWSNLNKVNGKPHAKSWKCINLLIQWSTKPVTSRDYILFLSHTSGTFRGDRALSPLQGTYTAWLYHAFMLLLLFWHHLCWASSELLKQAEDPQVDVRTQTASWWEHYCHHCSRWGFVKKQQGEPSGVSWAKWSRSCSISNPQWLKFIFQLHVT